VRELRNLAERIAVMYSGCSDNLSEADVAGLLNKRTGNSANAAGGTVSTEALFEQNINDAKEAFEKQYLEFHLSKNNGIISKTAAAIGIYPSNLHAKLKKYNISTLYKEGQ
jgi:two-component system nitrogen regulation response regulator NtrX